jgi:hypothetical protein
MPNQTRLQHTWVHKSEARAAVGMVIVAVSRFLN